MIKTKLVLIVTIIALLQNFMLQAKCPNKKITADYVIVGVGTAGAVLARKLSDDKKTSVIALHKGENLSEDPEIKFTENIGLTVITALFGNSEFYQTGQTIPQPFAFFRELLWVLALPGGGASSINAGAWCRSTNQINAQWEAIAGPLWSSERILNGYKSLEKYKGQTTNRSARGFRGPINIRQNPQPTGVSEVFTEAMVKATGFPFVLDYNDPNTPIGISKQLQYTQKGPGGSLRVSSLTAFLPLSVMLPNGRGVGGRKLCIKFNSTALKILWEGNKAVGVEYIQNGKTKQVFARKGVIVCAGFFSSNFLMHSGVGPASILTPLGIPVIFDNPNVGQGLADQPHVLTLFSSNPDDSSLLPSSSPFDQIAWLPAPGGNPTIRSVRLATVTFVPGITAMLVDLVQPLSRGRITINSADPLAPPVVDLGEFSNSADLTLFQQAFQVYVKAINLELQKIDPFYGIVFPDPSVLDDIDKLTDFIKAEVGANMHFQSHCRMAPQNQGGVVDSTGKVYGTQNLFVADDSVVPMLMDGSPMASAYLIAANIAAIFQGL